MRIISFGKFTKVLFEPNIQSAPTGRQLLGPRIVGSYIETYLLEKSRVVFQEKGRLLFPLLFVVPEIDIASTVSVAISSDVDVQENGTTTYSTNSARA